MFMINVGKVSIQQYFESSDIFNFSLINSTLCYNSWSTVIYLNATKSQIQPNQNAALNEERVFK